MAKPDSFCGCIALRTGCYIVAILYLVEAALYILVKEAVLFTALIIWIILIIVLFIGLRKNQAGNLRVYLIYDVLFSLTSLFYIVTDVPRLPMVDIDGEVLAANLGVLYACYRVFCWFVIRSQYVALKMDEENKEATQATIV